MSKKYTIKNVPIVEAGVWHQGATKITEEDLDELVANYEETKDRFAPYIVLGSHTSKKKMEESDAGIPSFGVLTNIRKVGNRLVADLSELTQVVRDLIVKGAYRRPSIEMWLKWNDTVADKVRGKFLAGIALLGAVHPAANTLPLKIEDVAALYASGGDDVEEVHIELEGPFELEEDPEKPAIKDPDDEGGDNEMDEKIREQYEENLRTVKEKLEAAEKANVDTVDEFKTKVEELEAKIKVEEDAKGKAAAKAKDEKIALFLEEQTKAGKLIPAQNSIYAKALTDAVDLDAEMITMKAMFEELPKVMDLGGEHGDGEDGKDEAKELTAARAKSNLKVEMAELGLIGKADEKEIEEYAAAVATRKVGDVHNGMEQARERLAKELVR